MLNNDKTLLPMRLSDYQFGSDDYEAYVRHRAQLLTSPRGRAALLRGGIVARIAREHIAIESALLGPSSAVINTYYSSRYPAGIRRNPEIPTESAGIDRNSGIPADSGGINRNPLSIHYQT